MTNQVVWPRTVLIAAVATTAAVGSAQTGFSDDGAGAAGSAAATTAEVLIFSNPAVTSGGKYEYDLRPFHHTNFDNRREFEDWLDDLGAKGWHSIAHVAALSPPVRSLQGQVAVRRARPGIDLGDAW